MTARRHARIARCTRVTFWLQAPAQPRDAVVLGSVINNYRQDPEAVELIGY